MEKGLMWFSLKFHTKNEDELEKDWKAFVFLPSSLSFLNTADQPNNSKYGTESCILLPNTIKTQLKMKNVKSLKKNASRFGNTIKLS